MKLRWSAISVLMSGYVEKDKLIGSEAPWFLQQFQQVIEDLYYFR